MNINAGFLKNIIARFFITFLFLNLVFVSNIFSAVPVVDQIEFIGAKRVPVETLESKILTKKGYIFEESRISKDIKALYELGQFDDIKVSKISEPRGIKLIFELTEKPFITEISFSGNKKIKDKDLIDKVTIRTYRPLNGEEVTESISKILEEYAKKKYYLAEVDYHIEEGKEDGEKIVFDIKENKGAIIREVRFTGNNVYTDNELRKIVATKRKGIFSFLTSSGKYSEEQLNDDIMRLTFHYLDNGYLRVKVSHPQVTISSDRRYIFVIFPIKEGEKYKLNEIKISGDILTTPQELMSTLIVKKGQIYSQSKVRDDVMNLTELYGNQGYAYANVYPDIVPNDEDLTADIDYSISKGNKIYVEKINIVGNKTTRDKVIRRELKIMENDRYSEESIRKSKEKLMQLGYFEEVNFSTPRGTSDDRVDLNIDVKEKSTGQFNVGVGFSSFEYLMFNASVQKSNFFGYGISGQISTQLSSKRQFFYLQAQDPYFLDTNLILGGSVYHTAYAYPDFWRKSTGGDLSFGRRFYDKYSASLGYKGEQVSADSFSPQVPQFFRIDSSGLTSALTYSMDRDDRDNRLSPRKGTYNVFSTEWSTKHLGADNEHIKLNYKSSFYQPIWRKFLLFKAFGRIGYMKSLNDRTIPIYDRYYLGGAYDLRGYYPNSVGPALKIPVYDSGGETLIRYGGNKELLLIGELEFILSEKIGISVVSFFDAGNTYAETENYSFRNFRKDYGFGFRWNSPMGPLRFEWGIPLDKRPDDDDVMFNFSIGNSF